MLGFADSLDLPEQTHPGPAGDVHDFRQTADQGQGPQGTTALLDVNAPNAPSEPSPTEVEIACPNCAARYRIVAGLVGRRLSCRYCREVWRAEPVRAAAQPRPKAAPAAPRSSSHRVSIPRAGDMDSIVLDTNWAGRRIGRYNVQSLLGRGGMGVVWKANDESLQRAVALKILGRGNGHGVDPVSRDLFLQEARAAAKLQHPHVVGVHELGEDQGFTFIALEYMHEGTLKEAVDKYGAYKPRRLFELMVGPARALALAHRRGIIHRDLKPGNLMFDDHGHLKLTDFGLAHVNDDPASLHLKGRAVGSLGWIAPEVANGNSGSPQTDIYSFGLCVLFALTARTHYKSDTRSALLKLHQAPPPTRDEDLPALSPRARAMLRRCLALSPGERFVTMDELVDELIACAGEPEDSSGGIPGEMRSGSGVILTGVAVGSGSIERPSKVGVSDPSRGRVGAGSGSARSAVGGSRRGVVEVDADIIEEAPVLRPQRIQMLNILVGILIGLLASGVFAAQYIRSYVDRVYESNAVQREQSQPLARPAASPPPADQTRP